MPLSTNLLEKLDSKDSVERENALFDLIETGLDEAAPILVRLAEWDHDINIYEGAIKGFLKIHPSAIKEDLFRIARSKKVAELEFSEMFRSFLVTAIGLMNDEKALPELRKLEQEMRANELPEHLNFWETLEFAFLVAYANLRDKQTADTLVRKILELGKRREIKNLGETLCNLRYCNNLRVAVGLTPLLDVEELAVRAIFIDWSGPPKNQAEEKIRRKQELSGFMRVKDCAFVAISRILENGKIGYKAEPSSTGIRYTDKQISELKTKIKEIDKM